MTVTSPATPAVSVGDRWPDVAQVPQARLTRPFAAALMRRVARRLPLKVVLPDGACLTGGRNAATDGVATMIVRRPDAFYRRLGAGGLIGFGEAYQAADWVGDDLPGVLSVIAANADRLVPRAAQWLRHLYGARQPASEANTVDGARRNIHRHYDLSNELFGLFLDESLTYSSALFTGDPAGAQWDQLEEAQHRKIDRLLDAARVGPGTRLLEIGTGWGALAVRAASRGATVNTITISKEQHALASERISAAGLADRVTVELRDYRQIEPAARYDAIVSVEMIEAVGHRYWPAYFATLDHLLAPGGTVAIQAITMAHKRMRASRRAYTWIHKYIFPGGLIPSVAAIRHVLARHTTLAITDDFAFGPHYAATLRLWRERFLAAADRVAGLGFDDIFRRTWEFYLAYSQAGFATRYLDVNQLVMRRCQ